MRGEVDHNVVELRETGITPACAGRSDVVLGGFVAGEDHPRVCGEKPATLKPSSVTWGSPPRVRGEEPDVVRKSGKRRITPACAGRRQVSVTGEFRTEDHPRVCGEKQNTVTGMPANAGSPPRVRGEGKI